MLGRIIAKLRGPGLYDKWGRRARVGDKVACWVPRTIRIEDGEIALYDFDDHSHRAPTAEKE